MKVEILQRESVYRGFFHLLRVVLRYQRFDGRMSRPVTLENLERGQAAAVLLYDPRADRVALIRQFRLGAWLARGQGWTWEIVAGACDGDPDPEAVARREVREETGIALAGPLTPIATFYLSPSGSTERIHLYLGLFDSRQPLSGGGGLEHEGEDIAVELVPFARAWEMVAAGEIDSATPLLALQWLQGRRQSLMRDSGGNEGEQHE